MSDAPTPPPSEAPIRRDQRDRRARRRRWLGTSTGVLVVVAVVAAGFLFWSPGGASDLDDGLRASADGTDPTPPTPPATDTDGGPPTEIDHRLFVVGDSVMQAAAPLLAPELEGWELTADTEVGRFTDKGVRVTAEHRAEGDVGEVAVIGLGNNYNGDEAEFAFSVEAMMSTLEGVDFVLWLSVGEYTDDRSEVNDVLRAAAARHPNLTIVDWNAVWAETDGLTGHDDLHLTPDGAEAMASLVAEAVWSVTRAAGVVPAPGAGEPTILSDGDIPGSSGSSRSTRSSSSSGSSGSSRARRSAPTTAPAAIEAPSPTSAPTEPVPPPPGPEPTSPAPEPTSPAPTSPPAPPAGGDGG